MWRDSETTAQRRATAIARHLTAAEALLPPAARKLDGKACVVTVGAHTDLKILLEGILAQKGVNVAQQTSVFPRQGCWLRHWQSNG